MRDTVLTCIRGDDNFFDLDADVDLDAGDQIWFKAAHREADLNETDALIKKGRNVAGQSGIADIDAPTGKFQLQLEPADLDDVLESALVYKIILRKVDSGMDTTLHKGPLVLTSRSG